MQTISKNKRLEQLKAELKKAQLDACLIENSLDLFYYTGLQLSAGRLLVHAGETLLLVDGRYLQAAQKKIPQVSLDSREQLLGFCQRHKIRRLGIDGRTTSYDQFSRLEGLTKSQAQLVSASSLFNAVRALKDREEIVKMKKSAALLWKGFLLIRRSLKKGITEKELARKFEIFCLQKGAEGLAFEPIIAFGANSAMPHYRSQDVPLKEGDAVLIDIGIILDHYRSDMTRVVFFKKKNKELKHLYEIVQRAQKSALSLCRPGIPLKELDLAARQVMREEKVEELFIHSLGHGIGLETHEFPRIKYNGDDKDVCLQSGMVITVEPGLYVPGKGGVRYEDTIVITSSGYTNFYPE